MVQAHNNLDLTVDLFKLQSLSVVVYNLIDLEFEKDKYQEHWCVALNPCEEHGGFIKSA